MDASDVLRTDDGALLPLRMWLPAQAPAHPPRAVVVAAHGFNDHAGSFTRLGTRLAAAGMAVYAYDQRGFGSAPERGRWAGAERMAEDVRCALRSVADRYPSAPLYLLGDSMGGAVAALAVAHGRPPPLEGVILVAPALWARSAMPAYQRAALAIARWTVPWLPLSRRLVRRRLTDNEEVLRALREDPLVIAAPRVAVLAGLTELMTRALAAATRLAVPVLLQYGARDESIPPQPVEWFWRALPRGFSGLRRLALYDDGWHLLLRDRRADQVIGDLLAWIDRPNAPLPSAADRDAVPRLAALARSGGLRARRRLAAHTPARAL